MSGTKAGALKAKETIYRKHGADFFARIGQRGGQLGTTGGFAAYVPCNCNLIQGDHKIAQCAGVKGGTASRRKAKV